jgi:hypothetical protein
MADKLLVADFSDLAQRELIGSAMLWRRKDDLSPTGSLCDAISQTLRKSLGNGVAPLPSPPRNYMPEEFWAVR